jgi:hypothetical protein
MLNSLPYTRDCNARSPSEHLPHTGAPRYIPPFITSINVNAEHDALTEQTRALRDELAEYDALQAGNMTARPAEARGAAHDVGAAATRERRQKGSGGCSSA